MSVDHTKVVYYSGFSAYKNVNVYTATISVTSTSIAAASSHFFETTVNVEDDTKFAYVMVQANDTDALLNPGSLEWRGYPANATVWQTLSTNPYGDNSLSLSHNIRINGNQVTFRLYASNPYDLPIAFDAIDIGVQYATFTIE